jgi:MFS family permease
MSYSKVLSIRPFRDLWLGQIISQLGDSFYYVVFTFMVKIITNSYAMVGWVAALELLPFLVISPFAGVVADRVDRRKLMLVSDLLCLGILLCFGLVVLLTASNPPVWTIFLTAFSLSVCRVFFMPAKNAALPALVPADSMMTANALSATTQNMVPLVSLAFSAAVIASLYAASKTWFFLTAVLVNALSFAVSAVFIARLPKVIPDRKDGVQPRALTDLRQGLSYIRQRPELFVLVFLSLALNLFISPFYPVYMAVNDLWFGGKPQSLAIFEGGFFFGMIIGSALVGKMRISRVGQGYIWGLAGVGFTVLVMAWARSFGLFLWWQVAAGLCLPFASIPFHTFVQVSTPDAFRGRVNSVLSMTQMGIQPVGLAMAGGLLDRLGAPKMFLIMGAGMGGAALLGLFSPAFRNATMPKAPADGGASGEDAPHREAVGLVP